MIYNKTSQRYVFKLHSKRIIKNKYDLTLTLDEARKNDELIALSESQVMRYIDFLNGAEDTTFQIYTAKHDIKELRKLPDIDRTLPMIRKQYELLDRYMFKQDYLTVVMDSADDYRKLCEHGFYVNGIPFHRLLGTPGGLKKNTITFVNANLYPQLLDFLNCGRDMTQKFIPAKLEAYNALVCSSSTPVSYPNGVLVVRDCVTQFTTQAVRLDDTETDEPVMTEIDDYKVALDNSDGYGMAMPALMERWGDELQLGYSIPACIIRNAFCKGAVFPVDFQKFCDDHGMEKVKDVWGNWHDIHGIELVLTESMLKLWSSYSSIDDYLAKCKKYRYTFGITKVSEERLENQRTTNYQFLQSYEFSDEEIDEFIAPTVDEIKEVMEGDVYKTILYAAGNHPNFKTMSDDYVKALLVEPELMRDPYVQSKLYEMIKKRIDRAKIGVINVAGNYSLILGDPYALCQSMCGLEVTGLLGAGEVYSEYWAKRGVDEIAIFRAPMTAHNNIRIGKVAPLNDFYKYITTATIFNAWDTCFPALNGADADGDAVITTSNPLLVGKARRLPFIDCVQRSAPKFVPTEQDIIEANIKSFGNDVGAVTNRVTSMFDVQAKFEPGSKEYETLAYRIKCGQLYQQATIDSTKGIEVKAMPKSWYDFHSLRINGEEDDEEAVVQKMYARTILADKKPYFMQYVYPEYKKTYDDYIKSNSAKCIMRFDMSLEELAALDEPTPEQQKFLEMYEIKKPLTDNGCTVNRICHRVEDEFGKFKKKKTCDFDVSILKSDVEYDEQMYAAIESLYKEYQSRLSTFMYWATRTRITDDERRVNKYILTNEFDKKCYETCPNEKMLCNILIDLCYSNNNSKSFVWDICGDVIIKNLLEKHGGVIRYPRKDANGTLSYKGETYRICEENVYDNE